MSEKRLTVEQLAFFVAPRTWIAIMAKHGAAHPEIRDAMILADCDGGDGYLDWVDRAKAWQLTDRGRAYVQAMGGRKFLEAAAAWICPTDRPPPRVGNKPGPKPKPPRFPPALMRTWADSTESVGQMAASMIDAFEHGFDAGLVVQDRKLENNAPAWAPPPDIFGD